MPSRGGKLATALRAEGERVVKFLVLYLESTLVVVNAAWGGSTLDDSNLQLPLPCPLAIVLTQLNSETSD